MKIKVTNNYILNLGNGLREIRERDLPARLAFHLIRVSNKITEEARNLDRMRGELFKKYAELEENGRPVVSKEGVVKFKSPEAMKEFTKEMTEILTLEAEIDIQKVKVDLDKLPDINVKEMALLEPLIDVGE